MAVAVFIPLAAIPDVPIPGFIGSITRSAISVVKRLSGVGIGDLRSCVAARLWRWFPGNQTIRVLPFTCRIGMGTICPVVEPGRRHL